MRKFTGTNERLHKIKGGNAMKREGILLITAIATIFFFTGIAAAQEVLPFPEPPSASVAGKTLKDSKHQWRKAESHLPADAPNILIIMLDDAGFGQSRIICNVHWQSDVNQGRIMGAATVARLHADPGFLADLEAAKAEIAALRKGN